MTAPEIIYNRVDSKKDNMGLTTWKNAPDGKILETDVTIAKNYLSQEEITENANSEPFIVAETSATEIVENDKEMPEIFK